MSARSVIIHYHLFKNAGTSVDALLERAFADRWVKIEFPDKRNAGSPQALQAFIAAQPTALAVSSHTAQFPVPSKPDLIPFPIVFVRHPLLRLRSAYQFERLQKIEAVGPNFARVLPFMSYVRALIGIGNRQARNFQTARFCLGLPADQGSELERAMKFAEALPFVGLVEDFAESARRLEDYLRPHFPAFRAENIRLNVTNPVEASLEDQLKALERDVGHRNYQYLLDNNADDIELFNSIRSRFPVNAG